MSPIFGQSPGVVEIPSFGESLNVFVVHFKSSRSKRMKEQFLYYLLRLFVVETHGVDFLKFIQRDFVSVSLDGMRTLFEEGSTVLSMICASVSQTTFF